MNLHDNSYMKHYWNYPFHNRPLVCNCHSHHSLCNIHFHYNSLHACRFHFHHILYSKLYYLDNMQALNRNHHHYSYNMVFVLMDNRYYSFQTTCSIRYNIRRYCNSGHQHTQHNMAYAKHYNKDHHNNTVSP